MKIIVWCLCMLFSIHAFADGEEGAKVGDQSPDFEYEDKDGKIYSLKDFRGKYVLIDFWATYCAPCKKEIPYLEKIQEKFKKKNIFFVSIAIDLNKKEWIQFFNKKALSTKGFHVNNDPVSGFNGRDIGSCLFHDSHHFVAHGNARDGTRDTPVFDV